MITIFQVSWKDGFGQKNQEYFKSKDGAVELLRILQQDNFVPGTFRSLPHLRKFRVPDTSGELLDLIKVIEEKNNEK